MTGKERELEGLCKEPPHFTLLLKARSALCSFGRIPVCSTNTTTKTLNKEGRNKGTEEGREVRGRERD